MKIVLEGIVGSTAYGLATPESDVDRLGAMQLPVSHFLGLSSPSEGDLSTVQHEPDVAYHDIGKFCRLALACNPTILELLWLPEELYTIRTEFGDFLIENRDKFLSAKRVQDAYMGYAVSQFKRLMERGDFGSDLKKRTQKHARHLLRLMHQGYTLYTTGVLPVRLEDPNRYHEFGQVVAEYPKHAENTVEAYKLLFNDATTVLPDHADSYMFEQAVINARIGRVL